MKKIRNTPDGGTQRTYAHKGHDLLVSESWVNEQELDEKVIYYSGQPRIYSDHWIKQVWEPKTVGVIRQNILPSRFPVLTFTELNISRG